MRRQFLTIALLCMTALPATRAAAQSPRGETSGAWRQNWRVTLDLSAGLNTNGRGDIVAERAIGIDTHKVISGASGDWGTLVMQGYVMGADPVRGDAPPSDTMFMYRIFNLNITKLSRGLFNVRVGHFEIPFGLEHVVNTNGTLRDFMHGQNLGMKADWGVGVNGGWTSGEYEITWSRGTGNAPFEASPGDVFAGRVGTPRDRNLAVGGSFYSGLDRRRLGADVTWHRGLYGVLAEAAFGTDAGQQAKRLGVTSSLVELNRTVEDDRVLAYIQARSFSREAGLGWTSGTSATIGARLEMNSHWSVSAEYSQGVRPVGDASGRVLRSQARYRF